MHRRRSTLLASILVAMLALAASPASAGRGPAYEIDWAQVDALVESIEADDVETVSGEIAGAAFVGQKPAPDENGEERWNGDLVVWAHGYRGEFDEAPLLTVSPPRARQWLLDNNYAWIASSYRRNSYDPGVGVLDSKNAAKRAAALFGQPDEVVIAGVSMGGHVTAASIEQFPNAYHGALPACGVLGDVELFDYFLDYNLGAAAFAGLDADDFDYPSDRWIADTVDPLVKPVLSTYDEAAAAGAPVTDDAWALDGALSPVDFLAGPGEDFKDFIEIGSGGERVTYDAAWDYWHVAGAGDFFFELGQGDGTIADRPGVVSQNSDMRYDVEYAPESGGIDDAVKRVTASNRVRKSQGLKPAILIDGDPRVPVLSIHTIGDLFVPIEMEQVYAREVAANGRSDLLVQRAIRDVGHCTFTDSEWEQSYADLFEWVETGSRPPGDDLIADISDEDLGCEWTISDAPPPGALRIFPCG